MPRQPRFDLFFSQALPQRLAQRASPPTPPDEVPPSTDTACPAWEQGLQGLVPPNSNDNEADRDYLGSREQEGEESRCCTSTGSQQPWPRSDVVWGEDKDAGGCDARPQRSRSTWLQHGRAGDNVTWPDIITGRIGRLNEYAVDERMLEGHVKDLEFENQHLKHTLYMLAVNEPVPPPSEAANMTERSETRNLRQQLACMGEQCQSLLDEALRLQEKTAEAYRMLARERQERLEERNQQLTVVVAKHGLERRVRNREQDLQAEWRRNTDLSEKCQRLEEELAEARNNNNHAHSHSRDLPVRSREQHPNQHEAPIEDEWDDRPSHVPPEFGYSKFVRWKKRTRDGTDHGSGYGKKRKRFEPEHRSLQLAGSESPPQVCPEEDHAVPGSSAIDQMISGDFTESETPSRAKTPTDG